MQFFSQSVLIQRVRVVIIFLLLYLIAPSVRVLLKLKKLIHFTHNARCIFARKSPPVARFNYLDHAFIVYVATLAYKSTKGSDGAPLHKEQRNYTTAELSCARDAFLCGILFALLQVEDRLLRAPTTLSLTYLPNIV